jgi:hypothetical protein
MNVCPACHQPIRDDRRCPKCKSGVLRVASSRRVGDSQSQRLVCQNPKCRHVKYRAIPRESVWPRRRWSTLDKKKSQIAENIAIIERENQCPKQPPSTS